MSNEPTIVHTKAGEPVTRVSDRATGHHYTIPADAFDPARHRPLKSPALDSYGEPAVPKFEALRGAKTPEDEPKSTPDAGEAGAGEAGAGEASSSEGDNDTPPEDSEAQEAAQGADGEPGVYDDTDDHTEQEDQ